MAAIDQVIAKGGYVAPTGGAVPSAAPGAAPAALPAASGGGLRHFVAIWGRTLLGLGLAVGLFKWPWTHHCGAYLYFYMAAAGLLALAGLWVMRVSWVRRSGVSHLIGLLLLGYAAWLLTAEILPRTGYAKVEATWACPAP